MEQLFVALSTKRSRQWILEGNIRGCFDNINHQWMMETIPMDKKMLNKFLKAGYVYRRQLFDNKRNDSRRDN
jgi:RNA-directed DNA polymerase